MAKLARAAGRLGLAAALWGCTGPSAPASEPAPPPDACGARSTEACLRAAQDALGDPAADRRVVAEQFAAVCDAGVAEGCTARGRMHRMGRGVERSEADAERWYLRACALEDGSGCHAAGLVALRATPPDPATALTRFDAGCASGSAHACAATGRLLRDGVGVAQDAPRARALLAQSCEGGVLEACTEHAMMVIDGTGAEPDPVAGASLMRLACNQGELRACHQAATLYADGVGVPVDDAAALVLWRTACVGRVPEACAALEARSR